MDRAGKEAEGFPGRASRGAPFDTQHLDRLMEEAGLDALVVTSKHNVQYLLGGYRFFFFEAMDAIGVSRYLPVLVYVRGRLDETAYIGNVMESYERDLGKFWVPEVETRTWGSIDAMRLTAERLRHYGLERGRIGVEMAFLPADSYDTLRQALPDATFSDSLFVLERLRAVKTADELALLRRASETVVDAMLATIAAHGPGSSKQDIVETLRREEIERGLTFDYCLITVGRSHNRAPSGAVWQAGEPLSVDSGGNYKGYIGDLCRMGIAGEPDQELVDLLGFVEEVQQAARRPIRGGARGGDIFTPALDLISRSPHKGYLHFMAHGMGVITHEAPRLTSRGAVPYEGYDEDRPLQPGMVVSIETTMLHPTRGFVKLEDTVAVTAEGWDGFGDAGRGWNRAGRS